MAKSKPLSPVHAGEILREGFLKPMGLTPLCRGAKAALASARLAEETDAKQINQARERFGAALQAIEAAPVLY
jgi:hypothetical protein